ncbi:hypothetical protein KCMC57_65220 (plasmid) [Kitasatospora sp. CMC57]|uniref:Uncharacterized protein n=1 Tax=Kitasatospora sp. CMC57 TaxID=3231513 RepID=A0AB33K9K1_9ACTN
MPTHSTFNNLGGATVTVTRWGLLYRWTCTGCRTYSSPTWSQGTAIREANEHASTCRANPR